jgi:hypothetical protein
MDASSSELQLWINQLAAGARAARDRLLECAQGRLRRLAGKMFKGFPGVSRWEDIDDLLQKTNLKLCDVLDKVKPESVREFIGLAARQIRWILLDLARHYFGPQGIGRHHYTPSPVDGSAPDPPCCEPSSGSGSRKNSSAVSSFFCVIADMRFSNR